MSKRLEYLENQQSNNTIPTYQPMPIAKQDPYDRLKEMFETMKYEYENELPCSYTLNQFSKFRGVDVASAYERFCRGWASFEDIFGTKSGTIKSNDFVEIKPARDA